MSKGPDAFRSISEASGELGVPQHVLRFWETKFSFIRPMKRAGGRRFYRPQDLEVLRGVRVLLHDKGYTIKGVQRLHKEQGLRTLVGAAGGDEAVAAELEAELAAADASPSTQPGSLLLDDRTQHRLRAVLAHLEGVKARLDAVLASADHPGNY